MKTQVMNRSIIVSIFVIMLMYGVPGMSYAQEAPGTIAQFSDRSLAIVVRRTLGLDITDGVDILEIPVASLTKLTTLSAGKWSTLDKLGLPEITDLTGLEHATQLRNLYLRGNKVLNLTPLAQLTQLIQVDLWGNQIIDITPLTQLTELRELDLGGPRTGNEIVDITPLANLTALTDLNLSSNQISNITPLANLTRLTELGLGGNKLTDADITPLAQLTRLTKLDLGSNQISDLTPLAQLTQLTSLILGANQIRDLTPLVQLTRLTILLLEVNQIRDISPLAQLKQLTLLYLSHNQIRDVTPLAQLVESLTELHLNNNQIRDVSPLAQLTYLEKLSLQSNQIRDVAPLANLTLLKTLKLRNNPITDTSTLGSLLDENPGLDIDIEVVSDKDSLKSVTASARLNGSIVTLILRDGEFEFSRPRIADAVTISGTTGATFHWSDIEKVSDTEINIELTFDDTIDEDTTLIFTVGPGAIENYNGPALTAEISSSTSAAEGLTEASTTDAKMSISPSSVASPAVGQKLEFNLNISGGEAVAGYQATVQFDTTALRYVSSANGDYLPAGAFFVQPVVEGDLVKLNAASLAGESSGDGTLAALIFEVIVAKASALTLSDVLLSNSAGEKSIPQVEHARITEPTGLKGDVNGDGIVNIQDLVLVASNLGKTGTNAADVNGDELVNIQDLVLVAGALGTSAAAPSLLHPDFLEMLTSADVRQWLSQAQQLGLTDATSHRGILFLQQLLAALIPKETALLPNYPNPFNPETWIPYQLSKPADVTLTIYAVNGHVVRRLALGHQPAGVYQNRSRAAYWDGRNAFGEPVASGVYFYMLTAGDFTATRKMLIRK